LVKSYVISVLNHLEFAVLIGFFQVDDLAVGIDSHVFHTTLPSERAVDIVMGDENGGR
jgi:hypothetical protein